MRDRFANPLCRRRDCFAPRNDAAEMGVMSNKITHHLRYEAISKLCATALQIRSACVEIASYLAMTWWLGALSSIPPWGGVRSAVLWEGGVSPPCNNGCTVR